ncbi:MAG: InlB B-repeat-containing protein, partial [Clostridia bacterium]|nr:InlB B-repeat-containing protein [Clostridia bacterium]
MKNYGIAIKKLRRNADITQAQLAQKLNVSSQTVSKWENGVNLPDILVLEEMCGLFGVTMEEFLRLADGGELKTSATAQPEQTVQTPPAAFAETVPAASAAAPAAARRKIKPWLIVLIVSVVTIYVASIITGIVLFATKDPLGWFKHGSPGDGIYEKVNPSVFCITVQTENDTIGGSGFFIDSKGTAVTNYHVIEGIKSAKVKLSDGKEYEVDKILGHDTVRDIVIIHVNAGRTTPVKLANSDRISTGSTVYAIGYPESFVLGSLDSTMTDGIISKTSYSVGGLDYIQSTVDITHGNSGGVLVNTKGEVIGITTAGIDLGNVTYMNLSVPSNAIKQVKRNINLPVSNYASKFNRKITVTYMIDGETFAKKTVCAGDTVPCLTIDFTTLDDKYSSCEFLGWYADNKYNTKFDFNAEAAENNDLTLYAKLRFKETAIVYTGGSGAVGTVRGERVAAGESFILPENNFTRAGYKFAGWEVNGQNYAVGDKVMVDGTAGELTVNARWTGNSYTARFTYDGQTYEQEFVYGAGQRLPGAMFERTGYTHTGWQYNGKKYNINQTLYDGLTTNDKAVITVVPVWTPIKYTIKLRFDQYAEFKGKEYDGKDMGEYAQTTGVYGADPTESIEAPVAYGLVFEGWEFYSADGELYEGDLRYINPDPSAVVTARAKWVSRSYELQLMPGSVSRPIKTVILEGKQEYVLPRFATISDISYKGYHFGGWRMFVTDTYYDEEVIFEDGATVSNLMVIRFIHGGGFYVELYAIWEPNEFTISFDSDGGSGSMDNLDCVYDTEWFLPVNAFVKEGYVFGGWQYGDNIFVDGCSGSEIVADNGAELTFTAVWLKKYDGAGTQENPYKVDGYERLKNLSHAVQYIDGYDVAHYELTADIDCGGGELHPIGFEKPFKGVFNGNGHVISNAVFAATIVQYEFYSKGYKGMFGFVFGGQILNLGLKNYAIEGKDDCNLFAPLVCEYTSAAPIYNCFAEGTISLRDEGGFFAGLVYQLRGSAFNCYSVCDFNMEYTRSAGDPNSSFYAGDIKFGGFVGIMEDGNMWYGDEKCPVPEAVAENCYANTHINISVAQSVREAYIHHMGLFSAEQGSFKNCFATGGMTYDCCYDFNSYIRSEIGLFIGFDYFPEFDNVYVANSAQIVFNDSVITEVPASVQKTADDNLNSLDWLKENAAFDDTVWQENSG